MEHRTSVPVQLQLCMLCYWCWTKNIDLWCRQNVAEMFAWFSWFL